ncbi:alkaline phosphatase [Metabacillus fastidiosus]|uniref:alkaline phosphatase n=1 Tax=Metabacillus fastidiosus TaxID=1458 RepID=UPI0008269A65|nr:alkaline phosphatase [Metabacillus fastidiosus]MED4460961.1 alkaline phosphatase [Metabacillus fastidiosus]
MDIINLGGIFVTISKKVLGVTLASAVMLSSLGQFGQKDEKAEAKKDPEKAKNVIMLVMDGTSVGATNLARWYKGEPLALDSIVTGGVFTHSAESAITDSAPASTAMATGNKSNDKLVGVLPEVVNTPGVDPALAEKPFKPVANVLEGAKRGGKATGIISTSEIQHATPAGFSAHVTHRSEYEKIAEQQVYQGIDVVLGGGKDALVPGEAKNNRKDGENLVNVLKNNGYDIVENRTDLLNTKSDKIWGAFAPNQLAYDIDREKTNPNEPTLAQMTNKAINTLSKDKDGFFLFVEGSKVDWAAHANDPIGIIGDVLSFDAAVQEALDFAKKDKDTLVIAVSDHGNSGITMGNLNTSKTYPNIPVSAYIDPLKKASMTLEGALSQLKADKSNLLEVAALYGIDNPTDAEKEALVKSANLQQTLVQLLSNRANIGFSTGGHTGEEVFLYSYGPGRPTGLIDNTEIAHTMASSMGFDLKKVSEELFVEAEEAFKKENAAVKIDETDKHNPVLIVTKGNKIAKFPVNKNIMIAEGKETKLKSVVVQSKGKFYIPEEAVKLFSKIK